MPMYILGFLGMPRRVYTYAPDLGWNTLNLIASIGGYVIAVSLIIFVYNFVRSIRKGEVAGDNPWRAWTLEWATSSPPPPGNFTSLPVVHSERPLYDLEQAELAATEGGQAPEVYTLPPEPEQSTAAPFWVALALLVIAIGLLSTPVVIALGVLFLLVVLAVWMAAGWVEPELPEDGRPPVLVRRRRHAGVHRLRGGVLRLAHRRRHPPAHPRRTRLVRRRSTPLPGHQHRRPGAQRRDRPLRAGGLPQAKHGSFFLLLVLTIVLGAVFLGGQAWEYTHLGFGLTANLDVSASTR